MNSPIPLPKLPATGKDSEGMVCVYRDEAHRDAALRYQAYRLDRAQKRLAAQAGVKA
jgi:hypothetical protein